MANDGGSNPAVAATPSAPDLMEALEASLAAAKGAQEWTTTCVRCGAALNERVLVSPADRTGTCAKCNAELWPDKGAQEEEDPLVVGSERTLLGPTSSYAVGDSDDKPVAVPDGSVSWQFARSTVAGHAAECHPSKSQADVFALAALALQRFPVGPIRREDLESALKAVEPPKPGDPDPFGADVLEARAADIASKRRRPEPSQRTLVDQS